MQFQFSAGGIVFKKDNGQIAVLIGQHSGHHGWVFPKGLIGDRIESESKEETALREVKEETGVVGKILKPLGPVEFFFEQGSEKVKKTVYYFLMEYVAGDIKNHDWEMEKVEWIPTDKVEGRLTHSSDKKVWREASKLI